MMELKLLLSEQEQQWLEEIAKHRQLTASEIIKKLIKEQHEQLAMDVAFDMYPQTDNARDEDHSNSRSTRKAALKRQLIEKAMRDE